MDAVPLYRPRMSDAGLAPTERVEAIDEFGEARAVEMVKGAKGKRLTYRPTGT